MITQIIFFAYKWWEDYTT